MIYLMAGYSFNCVSNNHEVEEEEKKTKFEIADDTQEDGTSSNVKRDSSN